ncbi:MAG: hypothetical protein F4117_13090 [Acidimicrobiales bacterium]|nr:hypothetical protein [Acidimicrobiales bacterium]MXX42659.1 hypothetical protein [Acidimicrobiales bacterium]MYA27318.1 hypothetical protein [Acidimicrobiales bacterium]MYA81945.1 hypothetical protein [Acidimicrobiales bacterium]MYB82013.1 hypothetical protein [Acidimicrobiales bacterium]
MARPKSRHGGRVTPKGTQGRTSQRSASGRQRPVLNDRATRELAMLVADIEHCIDTHDGDDLIATEISVSCTIGMHLTSNWNPFGVRASAVLTHAETVGSPAAAVIAAGMSAYGPATVRDRARQVLGRLRADGVAAPEWAASLGAAEPVSAVKFRDEWDEYWTLVVEYARPDGSAHEVCVSLHPFGWGMAHDFAVAPAGQSAQRLAESGFAAETICLAEARELLVGGIDHLDEAVLDWWESDDLDLDADIDLRMLVGQRIEALPGGERSGSKDAEGDADTAEHVADVIRGFVALPVPLGENKMDLGGFVVAATMFSQACRDTDVLRWTPPKIETFVERFLPLWTEGDDSGDYDPFDEFGEPGDAFEFGEERLSTLDSALPRWLRYAAERRGERAEVLEANLVAAKSSLRKLRVKITGSPIPLAAPRIEWA